MINVLQMVFSPSAGWQRVALARPGILKVLFLCLVPLLSVVSLAEGCALVHWGNKFGEFTAARPLPLDLVVRYEATYFVLALLVAFGGAVALGRIAAGSEVPTTYSDCFATVTLGLSPIYFVRLLDSLPTLNTWLCWSIGALLAWRSLYHGVALVLKPDHTKGFGLYLLSALVLLLLSALIHFMALSVLLKNVVLPF